MAEEAQKVQMTEEAQNVQNGTENNGAGAKATVTFSTMKPQLVVEAPKASDAVQFYKTAFGAVEVSRFTQPKRKADQELPLVISAELKLGSAVFLVSDLADDASTEQLKSGGAGIAFSLETEEVDAAISQAVAAGAVAVGEVTESEGISGSSRVGKVKDPYGFVWMICTPPKDAAADGEARILL